VNRFHGGAIQGIKVKPATRIAAVVARPFAKLLLRGNGSNRDARSGDRLSIRVHDPTVVLHLRDQIVDKPGHSPLTPYLDHSIRCAPLGRYWPETIRISEGQAISSRCCRAKLECTLLVSVHTFAATIPLEYELSTGDHLATAPAANNTRDGSPLGRWLVGRGGYGWSLDGCLIADQGGRKIDPVWRSRIRYLTFLRREPTFLT
jgi:hypothetical protein